MTTQHTPAPWTVEPSWGEQGRFTISAQLTSTQVTRERGIVCSTDGTPFRNREQFNACLIAAAPDLLAALEMWVDNEKSSQECFIASRAAIAKATGGVK